MSKALRTDTKFEPVVTALCLGTCEKKTDPGLKGVRFLLLYC